MIEIGSMPERVMRGTLVRFQWHDEEHEGRVVSKPSENEVRVELEGDAPPGTRSTLILHVDNVTVDRGDLHKRYMATLWDLGLRDERKEVQAALNLPSSTKDFDVSQYLYAINRLVEEPRTAFLNLCRDTGQDAEKVGREYCDGDLMYTLKDYVGFVAEMTKEPGYTEEVKVLVRGRIFP
jgi:hypothetical protein